MGRRLEATDRAGGAGLPRAARVAIVNLYPVQYFAPLYAYLSAAPDLEITVLYCTDASLRAARSTGFDQSFVWDIDLLHGYESVFLGPRARTRVPGGFFSLIVPEVWGALRAGSYDAVVIHGHRFAVCWLAVLAARLSGVKVMLRAETHLRLQRSRAKQVVRRLIIGSLCRLCDRLLAIGTANADFYRHLGVPPDKIVLVPYAVDNERFVAASSLSDAERRRLRVELGVPPDRPVILYASKFHPRKRPGDVVKAAAELRRGGADFTVLMVGDGALRTELEGLVVSLALDNVVFTGFVNQSRLPAVFAASDVFVLPSENEPWGLVVNEGMCAGLPVVVSREPGCVPDLVGHGDNGFLFEAGDVAGLAEALHTLLRDPALRERMGRRSRERIAGWGFEQCLTGLRQALGAS